MTVAASALDSRSARQAARPERRDTRWRGALGVFAGWTVLAIVFAMHNYLTFEADGRPVRFSHALWWSVAEWYTWAVLTPVVIWLTRRWRVAGEHWARNAVVLLLAAPAVASLQVGVEHFADRLAWMASGSPGISVRYWLSDGSSVAPMELSYLLPRKIGFSFVTCIALYIVVHAVDYYRLFKDRELRAAKLESALAAAQLQLLRSQLQPHFLFNTLNGIASLIPEDPRAAEEMVEALSDLLRASLRGSDAKDVSLGEELDLLEHYLTIQERRFNDRLRVTREIDPDSLGARVPPLLLQPLVENAIRHGVAPRPEGGEVKLIVRPVDDALEIAVLDDGPGFDDPSQVRIGIGLSNTRQRLAHTYGDAATLELANRASGGAMVRVTVPR
ncbi:MAG TPA: histidine kinase [Gemmatimonadaceae bacterium]|nr:histidine kinase [Gemmatimonadaceae bacterium]